MTRERKRPTIPHNHHDRIDEERIHTHGWGQSERQLGIQRHQQRGNGSREDGGGEQGIGIHARLTEQRGMDCQYISHREEGERYAKVKKFSFHDL